MPGCTNAGFNTYVNTKSGWNSAKEELEGDISTAKDDISTKQDQKPVLAKPRKKYGKSVLKKHDTKVEVWAREIEQLKENKLLLQQQLRAVQKKINDNNTPQKYFCNLVSTDVNHGAVAWVWHKNKPIDGYDGSVQYFTSVRNYDTVPYTIVGHVHGKYVDEGDWTFDTAYSTKDKWEVCIANPPHHRWNCNPCGCGKNPTIGNPIKNRVDTDAHKAWGQRDLNAVIQPAKQEYFNEYVDDNQQNSFISYDSYNPYNPYNSYSLHNPEYDLSLSVFVILTSFVFILFICCGAFLFGGLIGFIGSKWDKNKSLNIETDDALNQL